MEEEIIFKVYYSDENVISIEPIEIIFLKKDIKNLKLESVKDIFIYVKKLDNSIINFKNKKCLIYNYKNIENIKIEDFHKTKEYEHSTPLREFPSDSCHLHFLNLIN